MNSWGTQAFLVTSARSVARGLWSYGESVLAERAVGLSPEQVLDLGVRAMRMLEIGEDDRIWPGGPKGKAFVLASIERFEGVPRPPRRRIRRPKRLIPAEFQETVEEFMAAARPVADIADQRARRDT